MSRQECSKCHVQTTEFSCKNCGSTKLHPVALARATSGSQRPLLEISHMSRARRDMLAR